VRRQEGWGNERAFDDDRLHSAGAFVVSTGTASGARTSGTTSTASTKKCAEYTYGGVEANQVRAGARAKITLKETAKVAWGHAAAWIGVGGREVEGSAQRRARLQQVRYEKAHTRRSTQTPARQGRSPGRAS
jgi:hypothetical protein